METDSFRPVFMDAPEALLLARNGVVIEANHEAARLLGAHTPEEVAGREIGQIVPMDSTTASAMCAAMARLARGDLRSYDMEISLPGPVFFPVVLRISGLGGGLVAISLREATHLRRLERDLKLAVESADALFDTCPVAVFRIDSEYRFIQASPSITGFTGWEPGDLRGRKCHEILAGRDSVCAGCPAALSHVSGAPVSTLVCDSQRQWRSSAKALGGKNGGAGAVVFIEEIAPGFSKPVERSASQNGRPVDPRSAVFDERQALDAAQPRQMQEVFACTRGPSREDSLSILALVDSELSDRLGRRVRVMPSAEKSPVPVSGPKLLDLVRRLAAADFGTCLGQGEEIVLRIDRADSSCAAEGGPGDGCLALSMGASEDLALMSGCDMRGIARQPVADAAGWAGSDDGSPGAVFVARSRGGRPFYQILLEAAGRDGSLH